MNVAVLQVGAEIASDVRACSVLATKIHTTGDLLLRLEEEPPRRFAMLRSTCGLLGLYLDSPSDQIPLSKIDLKRKGFREFLSSRRYAENSIRTYVSLTGKLLTIARGLGWDPDASVSDDWKALRSRAIGRDMGAIFRHFSHTTTTPSEVTVEALTQWGEESTKSGMARETVARQKRRLSDLLRDTGWITFGLPTTKRATYAVPINQFPRELKLEVEAILKWKQADFAINRPKRGKVRAVTADALRRTICGLAGYVVNVRHTELPKTFTGLVRQTYVEGFVEWMINERGVQGSSIMPRIAQIAAVVKYHQKFATEDFTWLNTLIDSIPIEDRSERRKRKEAKFVEYEILETIPAYIRAERDSARRKNRVYTAARLAMEELMMRWFLVLPWRQRNIRECRVGGPTPNLFKARIDTMSDLDKPAWVIEEEARNPAAEFWQVYFAPNETKTRVEVHCLLPRTLIEPLEEYLTRFRPILLKASSNMNLFVNAKGKQFQAVGIEVIVGKWTYKCAGVRANPHLLRDLFAYRWLKEHPKDYLILSKLLWHKNLGTTLQEYGSRFNVSSSVCALEDWLDQRAVDPINHRRQGH